MLLNTEKKTAPSVFNKKHLSTHFCHCSTGFALSGLVYFCTVLHVHEA